MTKKIFIGGSVESREVGGIVTKARFVKDDTLNKTQREINDDVQNELIGLHGNITALQNGKQNVLTFDNAPIEGSNNPVKSGGIYTAQKALSDVIDAILALIPSAASALNQLADKAFVNSSISTDTATFRGTSATGLTEEEFLAWADSLTHDLNDYVFWNTQDAVGNTEFKRYKWDGTQWLYEYTLNNSSFTADQWAAINSGITAVLVAKLNGLPDSVTLQAAFDAITSLIPSEATTINQLADKAWVTALINAINALIPAEASDSNQLADKAYVGNEIARAILAAIPAFKGQFVTLAELQAVSSPKDGDTGIVRTTDSDGHAVYTFYQYLNGAWNEYYALCYQDMHKPATTGTTGDYPYNGMGRIELPKNFMDFFPSDTWGMVVRNDVAYLIFSYQMQYYAVYNEDNETGLILDNNLVVEQSAYDLMAIADIVGENVLSYTEAGGVYTITKPDTTTVTSTELNNTQLWFWNNDPKTTYNVLLQSMFTQTNTVYVIQYDYDVMQLGITIPANCVLQFEGGSLSNGTISCQDNLIIDAEPYQIFNNILFNVVSGIFGPRFLVEWFGVNPNFSSYASDNSINLQKALDSSKNIHLVFGALTYHFDISRPLSKTGKLKIEGNKHSDNGGSCTLIQLDGTPIEDSNYSNGRHCFWLNITTRKFTISDLSISGAGSTAQTTTNFLNIVDEVGEDPITHEPFGGDIDAEIKNVLFYHMGVALRATGRGLAIINSRFQELAGILVKQTWTPYDNNSSRPPFDGRGFIMDNVRVHWAANGWAEISRWGGQRGQNDYGYFINILYNNPAEYDESIRQEIANSTFYGVSLTNIYMDGIGNFLYCNQKVCNITINNLFMTMATNGAIMFNKDVINAIITNNKILSDMTYMLTSTPSIYNYIVCNKSADGLIVSKNIFGLTQDSFTQGGETITPPKLQREVVLLGEASAPTTRTVIIQNVNITDNIISHARGLLLIQYAANVLNIFTSGNIFKNTPTRSAFFSNCDAVDNCIFEVYKGTGEQSGFINNVTNVGSSIVLTRGIGTGMNTGVLRDWSLQGNEENGMYFTSKDGYSKDSDGYTSIARKGTTATRNYYITNNFFHPSDSGLMFFDETLNKPVFLVVTDNGAEATPRYTYSWVDATGTAV